VNNWIKTGQSRKIRLNASCLIPIEKPGQSYLKQDVWSPYPRPTPSARAPHLSTITEIQRNGAQLQHFVHRPSSRVFRAHEQVVDSEEVTIERCLTTADYVS